VQGAGYLSGAVTPTTGVWLVGALVIVIGLLLAIGFLTPIASIAAAITSIVFDLKTISKTSNPLNVGLGIVDAVIVTLALAILGAGAFSLDSYLFGRREIIIPDISSPSK
jgi:uncharacterized membrane protein YphA (DoxX/SURF4 family)